MAVHFRKDGGPEAKTQWRKILLVLPSQFQNKNNSNNQVNSNFGKVQYLVCKVVLPNQTYARSCKMTNIIVNISS